MTFVTIFNIYQTFRFHNNLLQHNHPVNLRHAKFQNLYLNGIRALTVLRRTQSLNVDIRLDTTTCNRTRRLTPALV